MLRTITELVPFGNDNLARPVSVMYLANLGISKSGNFNYYIGYYECASIYSGNKPIRKFKFIENYDRMNSTFDLMKSIYDKSGWKETVQFDDIAELFDTRAKEDIGFNKD